MKKSSEQKALEKQKKKELKQRKISERQIRRAKKMAQRMAEKADEKSVENVQKKMDSMNKGPVAKIWDKVLAVWNGFISPDTPASLKLALIGALIYMVTPVDVIPDAIPGIGLADDAAVLLAAFNLLRKIAQGTGQMLSVTKKYSLQFIHGKVQELSDSIDASVTWMMIHNMVKFCAFIGAVLLISVPALVTEKHILASSIILLVVMAFYFVRWIYKGIPFGQYMKEFFAAWKNTPKGQIKKSQDIKNLLEKIAVEFLIVHFRFSDDATQALVDEDPDADLKVVKKGPGKWFTDFWKKLTRFTLRQMPADKRPDWILPCDEEIFKEVKPLIHKAVQSYLINLLVFLTLYVCVFILFLRSAVLTKTIGMTFGQFVVYPLQRLVEKLVLK